MKEPKYMIPADQPSGPEIAPRPIDDVGIWYGAIKRVDILDGRLVDVWQSLKPKGYIAWRTNGVSDRDVSHMSIHIADLAWRDAVNELVDRYHRLKDGESVAKLLEIANEE